MDINILIICWVVSVAGHEKRLNIRKLSQFSILDFVQKRSKLGKDKYYPLKGTISFIKILKFHWRREKKNELRLVLDA